MDIEQACRLLKVLEARREHDVAALAAVRQKVAILAQLVAELSERGGAGRDDDNVTWATAGGAARFETWRRGRLEELNRELALLRAECEVRSNEARRSVGRAHAFGQIVNRALTARRQQDR